MGQKLGQGPPRTIEFIVSPSGETTIEANNFTGKACLAATAPYEEALGLAGERKEKPEIRRADVVSRPGRSVGPGT